MTVRAKFTVAAGQFQNVKVEFEAKDPHALLLELDGFNDSFKQQLGEFHAELESHVSVARQETFEGVRKNAVEVLQSLGATVTEVKDNPLEPVVDEADTPAVVRPWNRTQAAPTKAWDKPKPVDLAGF